MFKDFGKRLGRDIKRIVDARLNASEITSQANVQNSEYIKAKQIDVNVISHKSQRYAVWYGGSLVADTVSHVPSSNRSLSFSKRVIRKKNMTNMVRI
jgi:actin-related protein 3